MPVRARHLHAVPLYFYELVAQSLFRRLGLNRAHGLRCTRRARARSLRALPLYQLDVVGRIASEVRVRKDPAVRIDLLEPVRVELPHEGAEVRMLEVERQHDLREHFHVVHDERVAGGSPRDGASGRVGDHLVELP